MDVSSLTGDRELPDTEKTPTLEYTAQAASPHVNGEVKLVVGEDGLVVTALFGASEIPYADMVALELADYAVTLKTSGGDVMLSRMGLWRQPFYDALVEAYNKKVLKALFVPGKSLLAAHGQFRYIEDGASLPRYRQRYKQRAGPASRR